MPQAKLSEAEAERRREAQEKEAALQRVAELEPLDEENANLQAEAEELTRQLGAEVAELTRQLEAATRSHQVNRAEAEELRQRVDDLETQNSALDASCAAVKEQEAVLEVVARSVNGAAFLRDDETTV